MDQGFLRPLLIIIIIETSLIAHVTWDISPTLRGV